MNSLFEKRIHRLTIPVLLEKYFSSDEEFVDNMPQAKLTGFQDESIREIVARAYEKSTFYREKMDGAGVSPADVTDCAALHLLPFTTKEELRGNPWALLACAKEDIALIQVSTGTTGGEEIYIMYSWEDFYLHDLAPGYPALVPVARGDICLVALPYEMSSAGLAFHKTFMEGCRATVIPAGRGGAYSTPDKTVRLMRDLGPTVLITTPSWAVALAEAAEEAGLNPRGLGLKKIWLTGEGCSPAFRERVEKIWGTVANFYYGSLECGCIGMECDAQNGYHVARGHVALEIVDPETGAVLEPGEVGEVVVSCLLRYHTPLLRYRTRDLGYLDPDPCPCGVALPRLFLRGRLVDQVIVHGVSFSPYYLEEFLMRLPEVGNWFQFVVNPEGSESLKIRCELAAGVENSPALAASLADRMEFAIGVPCLVEIVDWIPRSPGKTIRVARENDPEDGPPVQAKREKSGRAGKHRRERGGRRGPGRKGHKRTDAGSEKI